MTRLILYPEEPAPRGLDGQEFAALIVPVGEGRGLIRYSEVNPITQNKLFITSLN